MIRVTLIIIREMHLKIEESGQDADTDIQQRRRDIGGMISMIYNG